MGEVKAEPAWLLAKVDQRLALMKDKLDSPEGRLALSVMDVVLTPLVEPPEGSTKEQFERWDRTCDNCGKYCPTTLFTGHVIRQFMGTKVNMMFGVCPECKEINE
jgi:hypothetical protein